MGCPCLALQPTTDRAERHKLEASGTVQQQSRLAKGLDKSTSTKKSTGPITIMQNVSYSKETSSSVYLVENRPLFPVFSNK
jgi:hypothetical protein